MRRLGMTSRQFFELTFIVNLSYAKEESEAFLADASVKKEKEPRNMDLFPWGIWELFVAEQQWLHFDQ
jgi:hypothetical protein